MPLSGGRLWGEGWRYSAAAFSLHMARSSSTGAWPHAFLDDELGVGPGAVTMGIVDFDHDVLDADGGGRRVSIVDGVVERAEPEVALGARRAGPLVPIRSP